MWPILFQIRTLNHCASYLSAGLARRSRFFVWATSASQTTETTQRGRVSRPELHHLLFFNIKYILAVVHELHSSVPLPKLHGTLRYAYQGKWRCIREEVTFVI